ncbi:unnamed protein product, partial [Mesorhabditis spiculigera]
MRLYLLLGIVVAGLLENIAAMSICARRQHTIAGPFFQRVDLPSSVACVERCVEYLDLCKSALFIKSDDKPNGICQLHPYNSVDADEALRTVDPENDLEVTLFEIRDKCPPFTKYEYLDLLSPESLARLSETKKIARALTAAFDNEIIQREDASDRRNDLSSRELSIYKEKSHGYATMHSLDEPRRPNPQQNPFDSSSRERNQGRKNYNAQEETNYGPSPSLSGLTPIRPIQILHQGRPMLPFDDRPPLALPQNTAYRHSSCPAGSACAPTLFQVDKSPCPAHQGDPCAPKPQCAPQANEYPQAPCQQDVPEWSEWTACSVSCGMGQMMRTCTGGHCPGISMAPCFMPICQEWGPWGQWTGCSATCGAAQKSRRRQCIGGNDCVGGNLENQDCYATPCPEWSEWGDWEGCTQSCGQRREKRYRQCQGGLNCPGMPVEERICDKGPCPYWASWSRWDQCTATCGGGFTTRSRECVNGPGCSGEQEEKQPCNLEPCPAWADWTEWSLCPPKCGEESARIRNRACYFKGSLFNGCEGPAQDQSPCPVSQCPKWNEWSDWSECSHTCGQGTQIRTRTCEGNGCDGPSREMRFCQISVCPYWGEWGQWSGCSVTCGLGVCERKRKCVLDELINLPNLDELEAAAAAEEESIEKGLRLVEEGANSIAVRGGEKNVQCLMKLLKVSLAMGLTLSGKLAMLVYKHNRYKAMFRILLLLGSMDGLVSLHWMWFEFDYKEEDSLPRPSYVKSEFYSGPGTSYQGQHMLPQSAFAGLQPIVPVNFRGKRETISHYAGASECQCQGPAVETKICSAPPKCEVEAEFAHDSYATLSQPTVLNPTCEWTNWGQWCGCEKCREGRETRRRFCDLPAKAPGGPTRPDPTCRCNGSDMEERGCRVKEECEIDALVAEDRTRPSFIKNAPDVSEPNDKRPPSQKAGVAAGSYEELRPVDYTGPIYSNVEITSIQKGPWNGKPDNSSEKTIGRAISVQEFKKDALLKKEANGEDELVGNLCRWSKWSDWSECHETRLKQRKRACVGLDPRVSTCQCMGLDLEETSCIPTQRVASSVEFIALTNERKTQRTRQELITAPDEEDAPVGNGCEWTRWSQWSPCTATCGIAERIRRRRCSCANENDCGGEVTTETDTCDQPSCIATPRPFPKFNIFQ